MPEPFSLAFAVCMGYGVAVGYSRQDSSASSEGKILSESLRRIATSAESSESLFGSKLATIGEIYRAAEENDLDEETASTEVMALRNAEDFIRILPKHIQLPEVAVDQDGEIALDWVFGRFRRLSLAIDGSGRIAFAWLQGREKGHAVTVFDGERIPSSLLQLLHNLGEYGTDPSIRFA